MTDTATLTDSGRRLDANMIVEAGLRLAARGAKTVSVRALGTELAADPTAIYRHFRSKDDLMRALLDALHLKALDRLTPSEDWRDRIMDLGAVTLAVHVEHPAIAYEATTLTTRGPGEARTIEYILEAFEQAGLADQDLVRHYALLGAFMLSQTAAIARTRSESGQASESDPKSWLDGALRTDPALQPRATALHRELSALNDDEIYRFGLRSIIESAQRAASGAQAS